MDDLNKTAQSLPEALPDMSLVLTERAVLLTRMYNQCRALLVQAIKERDEYKAQADKLSVAALRDVVGGVDGE